ncbi:MAG: ketoacyl-ACP synthase III [Candidatus Syntrophonatronum acetioxidans]|uniref:Beta-ketoacyl-[acyl-carrier-protein] synthase III n=1 Tax=Candidatus Syntrophonatronum acetioxidans TaxID=1795816 RepID=A0A424YBZ5_9FIRM|nr:MAG: ketoacyl-ACP synthase III [Candidatus Syntrophonatronum acetioxidans]
MQTHTSARIIGTGSFLPDKVLTNLKLEKIVDTNDEWIRARTGIVERRIADRQTAASDLSIKAAEKALKKADIKAEELDLIIVATITPDYLFPATACIVQDKLGAKNAAAFDLLAACSGFVYGVSVAEQFIKSRTYKYILVIGVEVLSKFIDWTDRNTCILFGDGAGAAVLGPAQEDGGFIFTRLGADGSGGDHLMLPGGGSRIPCTTSSVENGLHYLRMSGSEIFKFAVKIMEESTVEALENCGLEVNDIDLLIPHQANLRIINSAAKRIGLPVERVWTNIQRFGNMSAASIPVALDEAVTEKRIVPGSILVLVGFGAGLTWGINIIRW